jgi:hypothetical protein
MREPRIIGCELLLAGAIVALAGCALVSKTDEPGRSPHLPPVEVTIPGKSSTGDSAPLWQPTPSGESKDKSAAAEAKPALPPSEELRQILGKLQADGTLERQQHDEVVKNLDRTDPATLQHLLWMYRAIANGPASKATPTTATDEKPKSRERVVKVEAREPIDEPAKDKKYPVSLAVATDEPVQGAPAEKGQPAKIDEPPQIITPPVAAPRAVASATPVTAALAPAANADWNSGLDQVIRALEASVESAPSEEQARLHAQLRMLYLTAGRKNDAIKPIPSLNEPEQDFFSKEIYGLATYLDDKRVTDRSRRAAEASRHLSDALVRLGEASTLSVKNLAFCSEVASYGVYTGFAKLEFKPGQQVLLYAEIENFKSEETPKGFHTALKSHYQILDSQGRKVEEHDFELAEERCQNPRRDYFLRYFVNLPARIYDGRYTLQLTVEDTLGKKVGQSTIEFTIKSK